MSNQKNTPRKTVAEWEALVTAQVQNKQTIQEFCEAQQINRNTFVYWKGRLKKGKLKPSKTPKFMPLSAPPKTGQINLYHPRGIKIELPTSYPLEDLSQLVNLLSC